MAIVGLHKEVRLLGNSGEMALVRVRKKPRYFSLGVKRP